MLGEMKLQQINNQKSAKINEKCKLGGQKMGEIEVRFSPPLKKKEFLEWMDENLPMPKN